MNKELKIEVWDILESYKEKLSGDIGWGSMDSLCDELITLIKDKDVDFITISKKEYDILKRDSNNLGKIDFSL